MRKSLKIKTTGKAVFHDLKAMCIDGMQMQKKLSDPAVLYCCFAHGSYFMITGRRMQEIEWQKSLKTW